MFRFVFLFFTLLMLLALPSQAIADCAILPSGSRPPGTVIYNADHGYFQGCEGDTWVRMRGIGSGAIGGGAPCSPGEIDFDDILANEPLEDLTTNTVTVANATDCPFVVTDGVGSLYGPTYIVKNGSQVTVTTQLGTVPATVVELSSGDTASLSFQGPEWGQTKTIYTVFGDKWASFDVTAGTPPYDPGSGFFVLSRNTWEGDLGGLSGADSICLTELQNNDWAGKENATLNASTVKAFLCDGSACNNLQPSTKYYFAKAGYGVGGASFTTNASGQGPGDSANWSGNTYFGNFANNYWSGRAAGSGTLWANSSDTNHCTGWTTAASGMGRTGFPPYGDASRWHYGFNRGCGSDEYLVCFVDP